VKTTGRRLIKCPILAQKIQTPEGFQKLVAHVPQKDCEVLYVGAEPPTDNLFMYVLAPDKYDAKGEPRMYEVEELRPIEFIVALPGHLIPKGYKWRAISKAKVGLVFLFELQEESMIMLPGGRA